MSKKKGIIRLVVLLAVIAFVVYTAVSGLGSDRSGSLNDISLGLDLRGGVSITYEAVGDVNSQDMSDTKAKLKNVCRIIQLKHRFILRDLTVLR